MKWHDAKKELPKNQSELSDRHTTQEVLTITINGSYEIATYEQFNMDYPGKWKSIECGCYRHSIDNVTHWCYLDDIPKPE